MKSIRNLPAALFILGGFIALISLLHAQEQDSSVAVQMGTATLTATPVQAMTDEQVMLQAIEQTTPSPATNLPEDGNFHSAQHPEWPPLPGNIWNVPGWNLGSAGGQPGQDLIILDDLQLDYAAVAAAATQARVASRRAMGLSMDDSGEDGGFSMMDMMSGIPSNSLYLQIYCLSNSTAYLSLNNATDQVYEIYSTLALTNSGSNQWSIELELWPTNTNSMPFTVPELDRTSALFFWARD